MTSPLATKTGLHFFFDDGLTPALFQWLNFRQFVAHKKLKLPSATGTINQSPETNDYLSQWHQQHTMIMPSPWFFRMLLFAAILLGFGTMAGVLNYQANQPINIWLPLALFAFIPFLMTLSSFYFSVLSPAKQHLSGHPLLEALVNKLNLTVFLPYTNLLLPWLFWQVQRLALAFAVAALLGFFIFATFQDYRFAWSSTLITDNATMTQLMTIITWPWHWLVATPSAELISQSRIIAQEASFQSIAGESWWLTLVMAIVVYGILPRLLLTWFLRQRLVTQLRASIEHSGDIEQFTVAQTHQESHNPIQSDDDYNAPTTVNIDQLGIDLITWQQVEFGMTTVKNLGNANWLADEQWLASADSRRANPVFVLVDPMQTPTGELADCIGLLQQHNDSVDLVLYGRQTEGTRYQSQLKSWQYFAKQHDITLKRGR
jgi:hypothetical protein